MRSKLLGALSVGVDVSGREDAWLGLSLSLLFPPSSAVAAVLLFVLSRGLVIPNERRAVMVCVGGVMGGGAFGVRI